MAELEWQQVQQSQYHFTAHLSKVCQILRWWTEKCHNNNISDIATKAWTVVISRQAVVKWWFWFHFADGFWLICVGYCILSNKRDCLNKVPPPPRLWTLPDHMSENTEPVWIKCLAIIVKVILSSLSKFHWNLIREGSFSASSPSTSYSAKYGIYFEQFASPEINTEFSLINVPSALAN